MHFPGPWTEDGRTPCGEQFMRRSHGVWVTAVNSAAMPELVTCEACYATEDVKHRQDYQYGRHTGPLPELWDMPVPGTVPAGVMPGRYTPAGLRNAGKEDLRMLLYPSGDDRLFKRDRLNHYVGENVERE